MKALHEEPGERGHEEVMQQDGNNCAQELQGERKRTIKRVEMKELMGAGGLITQGEREKKKERRKI